MLQVKLVGYEELTEEEKETVPNNGVGKEYANYVKVTDGETCLVLLSDAVEPEDATFKRDFNDVISAIELAYKVGISHGRKLGGQ